MKLSACFLPARWTTFSSFTNKGRVYSSRAYELPEGSRTARGVHIANLLSLMPDENVTTMLVVPDFEQAEQYHADHPPGVDQTHGVGRLQ